MGGWGSGRHWVHKAKRKTSSYPLLDIRRLQSEGLLRRGLAFPYQLIRNGERTTSIDLRRDADRVTLSYRRRTREAEWKRVECPIQLEWTACNYGGLRAWFRCPAEGCGRRVAILYFMSEFACRRCHRLAYWSQRCSASEAALPQAQAIRERLGGSGNMQIPFPTKPKGMHWRTYRRLRLLHDDADARSWPTWMRRGAQTALLASQKAASVRRRNENTRRRRSVD
jgi:hypothetical protein